MRIALTGASGIVGGFALQTMRGDGHAVTVFDRNTGYNLGNAPDLSGHDALVHCAFFHKMGRYRGGEGDDPAGFRKTNLDGTRRLFDAASRDGVRRVVFMSSRAVHDGHPPGTRLTDDLPAWPTTLYGHVKAGAEAHLADLSSKNFLTTALRATGVYGPGRANKWRGLFADYLADKPIAPRIATEVHATDLADAILLLLGTKSPPAVANVSDLVLDRRDLLAEVQRLTGSAAPLPQCADQNGLGILECAALDGLGWRPGGWNLLRTTLPGLLDPGTLL